MAGVEGVHAVQEAPHLLAVELHDSLLHLRVGFDEPEAVSLSFEDGPPCAHGRNLSGMNGWHGKYKAHLEPINANLKAAPSNAFGGCRASFPMETVRPLVLKGTALKEVFEE